MNKKGRFIPFFHLGGWLLFLSLPFIIRFVFESSGHPPLPPSGTPLPPGRLDPTFFTLVTQGITGISFYVNLFLVFPYFIARKRYDALITIEVTLVVLSILGVKAVTALFTQAPPGPGLAIATTFIFLFVNAIAFSYYVVMEKIKADRREKDKEAETLKSELQFLRSQISPHFLFNVLNNTVALARARSEKLEGVLIELSNLLRYMLYETRDNKVSIGKEINYLKSYIYLQKMRFGENATIDVLIDEDEHTSCDIEPMLLIPFVENAFKHGMGLVEDPVIEIRLIIKNKVLYFISRNKCNNAQQDSKDDVHGIGLVNVKRRLDLVYGADYKLDIVQNKWFEVNLKIMLK
jgi:two-component system LytT family sensor kinase